MPLPPDPVWFISGCSTGFGRELARLVLARGHRVAATARDTARLDGLGADAADRTLPLALDVTDPTQIAAAVAATTARFGRIDVLVNNAGYGYQSSLEEGDDAEIRAQFDANVFGLFALTRAALPGMRERRQGHILNVTSIAGFSGLPGSGYYAASKFAVEGFTDALATEVAPLGIAVTGIAPGPFRTDWAGRSLRQTPVAIPDYEPTAGARLKLTAGYSGRQPGDPVRAAEAMIHVTEVPNPPRHLVLGAFGLDAVATRLKARLAEIESWHDVGAATDFPAE